MTSIAKKQPRVRAKNHIKESTGRKVFRIVNAVVLTALALISIQKMLPLLNICVLVIVRDYTLNARMTIH